MNDKKEIVSDIMNSYRSLLTAQMFVTDMYNAGSIRYDEFQRLNALLVKSMNYLVSNEL